MWNIKQELRRSIPNILILQMTWAQVCPVGVATLKNS